MDFNDSPQEAQFRQQARNWIAANAPHELLHELRQSPPYMLELKQRDTVAVARAWQQKKYAAGWACLQWPTEYGGRGATPIQRVIWDQEEGEFGKLNLPFGIGIGMAAPTLMEYASEEQKRTHLPRIAACEEAWCQLFSEPGAGSDLAGISTRAERDGDDWVINGQKVWTSWAQICDYGILLARTDAAVPKHKGLTMFFVDMRDPAVDIRPIHQMNEKHSFNEVYFTDLRIPDGNRLDAVGNGWRVALTTLMHERMVSAGTITGFEQLLQLCSTPNAHGEKFSDDREVRAKLAQWSAITSGLQYGMYRSLTNLSRGEEPGPENSIGKLAAASTLQAVTRYALDLLGTDGLCMDASDAHGGGWFQSMFLRSPGLRIEAGSDEILRNIIAERVLGLPGEPRVDKDIAFNASTRPRANAGA